MKKIDVLLSVFLSLFLISVCYGQDSNQDTNQYTGSSSSRSASASMMAQEVRDMENTITETLRNKDYSTFGNYLSDEFVAITDQGINTKAEEIQRVQKMNLANNKRTDEKVVFPADNVAILTYKSTGSRATDGRDLGGIYNVSTTFVKENGQWKAVEHVMVKSGE